MPSSLATEDLRVDARPVRLHQVMSDRRDHLSPDRIVNNLTDLISVLELTAEQRGIALDWETLQLDMRPGTGFTEDRIAIGVSAEIL